MLVLDRSGSDTRVNYPRLAARGDDVVVGGFVAAARPSPRSSM